MWTSYPFTLLLSCLLAYLLGSISFAIVLCKSFGMQDPRQYGSGNPGATNVLRSGNKGVALLTLLLDGAKGYVAVALVHLISATDAIDLGYIGPVGLAVFLGHLFPLFFRFQGGKGVATFLGVILGLAPHLGLGALACWLVVAVVTRYSSLAALLAALFVSLVAAFIFGLSLTTVCVWLMTGLLAFRHRANIQRLHAGTESRIGA